MLILRKEHPEEFRFVENLIREAFWDVYMPGADEHYLTHLLRSADCFVPELSFVAELDGEIAGAIYYSTARIQTGAAEIPVLTFGPLAVASSARKRGLGARLIRETLTLAETTPYPAVVIFGNPAYYSKHGFEPGETYGITARDGNFCSALQVFVLKKESLQGKFIESPLFLMNTEEVKRFDASFPPKAKHRLPSQIFPGEPD